MCEDCQESGCEKKGGALFTYPFQAAPDDTVMLICNCECHFNDDHE